MAIIMENIYLNCTLFSLLENLKDSIEEMRLKTYKAQNFFKPAIQASSQMVKVPSLSRALLSIIQSINSINDFKNYPFTLYENNSYTYLFHCLANMLSQDLSLEEIRYYSKIYINISNPNLEPAYYPKQASSNFYTPFSNPQNPPPPSIPQLLHPRTGTSSLPTIELSSINP